VQKNISGDRVAGVSLHLHRVPNLINSYVQDRFTSTYSSWLMNYVHNAVFSWYLCLSVLSCWFLCAAGPHNWDNIMHWFLLDEAEGPQMSHSIWSVCGENNSLTGGHLAIIGIIYWGTRGTDNPHFLYWWVPCPHFSWHVGYRRRICCQLLSAEATCGD